MAYVWDGTKNLKDEMIEGDFEVAENVTSLKGCPEFVGGDFICKNNPNLKSLKGAPERIGGHFECSNCENLETLKGCPIEITKNFICKNNPKLKTLVGGPKYVNSYICDGNENLESLKGAPIIVDINFICRNNPKLKTLEGCRPKKVGGDFICDNNINLERLKDCPKKIEEGGESVFSNCPNLKYIDCAPKEVVVIKFKNCQNLIIDVFPKIFDYIKFDKIPNFSPKALMRLDVYQGLKYSLYLTDDEDREKLINFIDKQIEQFKTLSKYDKENAENHFSNISLINKIFFR
jgi:hypothetical protein